VEPIKAVSLVDQVVDRVRGHIVEKGLGAGDFLPSAQQLGSIFGVSRGVVREALTQLEAVGIIDIANGRRPVVHRLEPNAMARAFDHGLATRQVSFRNIGTFRRTIECEAAVLAAHQRTDDDLHRLDVAIEGLRRSLEDPRPFLVADFELHAVIAQASGNPLYAITTEALTMTIKSMIFDGLCSIESLAEWKRILKTHEGIVQAIHDRNAAEARKMMSRHFDEALNRTALY
jgi:GntR family transcriptional repressor for pyruvate dehydrogenase complex